MPPIAENIRRVKERIKNAALRAGRGPDSIRLVAVTKGVDVNRIREAIEAGVDTFGENYIQEARPKIEAIGRGVVKWHFIGHLQRNKAKYAVKLFDLIHTVDSLELAMELNRRSKDKRTDVLIEVNPGGEETKAGVDESGMMELVEGILAYENLSVKGLMVIPPYLEDPEAVRPYFARLKGLAMEIEERNIPGISMQELSMGMSHDFEVAIEEGATIVRIGRAIFGERSSE
ncbi:MAG: YggS family pyridoxal phosphate-dependent enzyme [Deltaproteobacteria bacterium]|nr:YggS family pyridoxal phosphate-dependent enzyme [Deltaproteobacteria bacterium]